MIRNFTDVDWLHFKLLFIIHHNHSALVVLTWTLVGAGCDVTSCCRQVTWFEILLSGTGLVWVFLPQVHNLKRYFKYFINFLQRISICKKCSLCKNSSKHPPVFVRSPQSGWNILWCISVYVYWYCLFLYLKDDQIQVRTVHLQEGHLTVQADVSVHIKQILVFFTPSIM